MVSLIEALIVRIKEKVDLKSLKIKNIKKGSRFTCTLFTNNSCGLSYSRYNSDSLDNCDYLRSTEDFEDLDINKLLQFAENTENELETIIGVSVLNGISQFILQEHSNQYNWEFGGDPLDYIELSESSRLVMVGNIKKFLPWIKTRCKNGTIIDDHVDKMEYPFVKSPEHTQEYLEQADVVILTGSTLVNNTLETLLKWSSNARVIVVVGPTAGVIPEPLFERGVTIVSGMQVLDPQKVIEIVEEGGGPPYFKKFCRKYNIFRGRNLN